MDSFVVCMKKQCISWSAGFISWFGSTLFFKIGYRKLCMLHAIKACILSQLCKYLLTSKEYFDIFNKSMHMKYKIKVKIVHWEDDWEPVWSD